MPRIPPAHQKCPHVGIVGAGIAGLRCADVLVKRGATVTIFEARDRIGGRVMQSSQLGHAVDLGANYVYGTEDNPMFKLAIQTGTITHPVDEARSMYNTAGVRMTEQEAGAQYQMVWDILDDTFKYSSANSSSIAPNKSLMEHFAEKVKENNQIEASLKDNLLRIVKMWGDFTGSDITRQSLKFFWLEEGIDGDILFLASTYKKIVDHVAATALASAKILLGSEVTKIEQRGHEDGRFEGVLIKTSSGGQHIFDEVVVTAPLGWLKRNKSIFVPQLTKELSEAIDHISYGGLEKVWISFPNAFWDCPAGSENSKRALHPEETSFLAPEYAPETNPHGWNQEMVSLSRLPGAFAQPTLLWFLYGDLSAKIVDLVKNYPQDSPAYYEALETFFKPYYSRLPGYEASSPDCKPKTFLATQWQNDKWAGYGSYSNYQVGLEHGDKDIETMRVGMGPDRGIWLAGEHTAPFMSLGTVTGAYWSGEGVAKNIIKLYGIDHPIPPKEKLEGLDLKRDIAIHDIQKPSEDLCLSST